MYNQQLQALLPGYQMQVVPARQIRLRRTVGAAANLTGNEQHIARTDRGGITVLFIESMAVNGKNKFTLDHGISFLKSMCDAGCAVCKIDLIYAAYVELITHTPRMSNDIRYVCQKRRSYGRQTPCRNNGREPSQIDYGSPEALCRRTLPHPMDELTASVGLTRGALYHNFGDKRKGLLAAVVAQVDGEMAQRAKAAAANAGDDWERLLAEGIAYIKMALDTEVRRIVLLDGPAFLRILHNGPAKIVASNPPDRPS